MIKQAVFAFILGCTVLLPPAVQAAQEIILHRFHSGPGGTAPLGPLVMDSAGALYGTTSAGGDAGCGCGTVFKMTPPAPDQKVWGFQVLHSFEDSDGHFPVGLSIDTNGNLYGAVSLGGGCFDCGAIFMLTPPSSGQTGWTYQVLHHFTAGTDGANPTAPPTISRSGVLYGITSDGGTGHTCPDLSSGDCGTVYQLTPSAGGGSSWTYAIVFRFKGNSTGSNPIGGLYEAPTGTLYGTTVYGGFSYGTVFSLQPGSGGTGFTYTVIHGFVGPRYAGAEYPNGTLVGDMAGNLYGVITCRLTGSRCGTVFELTPPSAGEPKLTLAALRHFTGNFNGGDPVAVFMAANGSLYGTTGDGGVGCLAFPGCGVVFELTPPSAGSGGSWPLHILHRFLGGSDGSHPEAGLIEDGNGHLFGSTTSGGAGCPGNLCGVVFEIVP